MAATYDIPALESFAADSVDYIKLSKQVEIVEDLCKTLPEEGEERNALEVLLGFIDDFRQTVVASELVPDEFVNPEPGMNIVTWPESQLLMDHPDFEQECLLINDEYGLEKYGSSAFWVPGSILNSL